jgi:hypothetical protein
VVDSARRCGAGSASSFLRWVSGRYSQAYGDVRIGVSVCDVGEGVEKYVREGVGGHV